MLLKQDLGTLTEEVKVDVEEAINDLTKIVKMKRNLLIDFLLDKRNQDSREVKDRIDSNRKYIDLDPDPITGEKNVMRKLTRIDDRNLLTFKGFVEVFYSFGLSNKEKVMKRVLDMLKVYHWRLDTVDFFKLLRELGRYSRGKWDLAIGRATKMGFNKEVDKEKVAIYIQTRAKAWLKTVRATANLQETTKKKDRAQEHDLKKYSSKEIVETLQENIVKSGVDCKAQISQLVTEAGTELVSADKFREIIEHKLRIDVSRNFVDQLFKSLDLKKQDKVNIKVIENLVYSENGETFLEAPTSPEELLTLVGEAAHHHYDNPARFTQMCRHAHETEISYDEFKIFLNTFTRLKPEKIMVVFNHLDDARRGTLQEGQILEIWERIIRLEKANREANLNADKSEEKMKSFDMSGFGMSGLGGGEAGFGGNRQASLIDIGAGNQNDDVTIDDPPEFAAPANQVRTLQYEIEELVMRLALDSLNMIIYHGKNLKELYLMFADKVTKKMNFDEFWEAVRFICKEVDETEVRNLYLTFAWPTSKKLSYSRFLFMIEMGKKINSIYIKLRKRYGDKLHEVRQLYVDELNKLSVKRGDGFAPFLEVRKLFAINKIDITKLDVELLNEEGIYVNMDRVNLINVNQFVERVFQYESQFVKHVKKISAAKIWLKFRRYKKRQAEKKAADDMLKNIFKIDDSAVTKVGGKGSPSPKSKPKPLARKTKIMVPKSTEDKMKSLLPDATVVSAQVSVQSQKNQAMIEKILADIMDNAVHIGENNLLKKSVQRRYANRSVNKDNIVVINEETFQVNDIMPRSVTSIASIGRIFFMSNDGVLNQYDLANSQTLPSVDLSSKIPMKKDEVLDFLLDPESGLLYVLKVSMILEAWNIFQKSKSPASKLKLVHSTETVSIISSVYKNRYSGAVPSFLSLSQPNKQYLLANCTMINGVIYFLDPVSLSLLNQTKLRGEDMHISPLLNKIFFSLKPSLQSLSQQQRTFEKIFGDPSKPEQKTRQISTARFRRFLAEELPSKPVTEEEVDELVRFLDVNGDGCVDEDEWIFLNESARITSKKSNVHASYEIPEELRNMDRMVVKVFYDIYEFVEKKNINIQEVFKIFDADNSGSINESEFMEVLAEMSKDTTFENKRRFFNFLDKNGNKQIEIDEFVKVFTMFGKYSPQELLPSEAPRLDLFVVIEKAFEYGIDLESQLASYDQFKDGGIELHRFKTLFKSFPFGVTDEVINHWVEKTLTFTNDGNISYMDILNHEKYKRIKYIYEVKKGLKDVEAKVRDSEESEKYSGLQKIIIENIVHISAEDVFIYTVVSPKTSIIYVSRVNQDKSKERVSERFEAQLLARLVGHTSKEAPTITYVNESGCLLSGEKLHPIKEPMSDIGKKEDNGSEPFSRFYSNITSNKTRTANIMIWNLAKDLFGGNRVNPPWTVNPTRIIEGAHYDSIICLAYMPLGQLIVSSSVDGSIKLWDPVARPHTLVHKEASQKVKPGYYTKAQEEVTFSNQSFSEVSRFYSGELTCYSLICQHQRVPVSDKDGVPKFRNLEYLICMDLGKAQRTAGRLRTEGQIKIFGVERVTMEIPVSRFEEPIPKQLWMEITDLAISNRQQTKFMFKKNLPTSLDKIMSKVVIQKSEMNKITQLLKGITLDRFNSAQDNQKNFDLFNLLVHLPMRNANSNPRLLTIDEVHMHLKRNNYLFPSNLSKESFVKIVEDLIQKSSHYLVDHGNKNQNKFLNLISQKISKKEIEIETFFTKEVYSRTDLKRMFEQFADQEEEVEELISELDPFYSNAIKVDTIKTYFSSEIINAKMAEFARPNVIISQINAKLSRSNKVELLRNLFSQDAQGIGKISLIGFLQAFSRLSRTIDENLLKELFKLMSEREEDQDFLDLSYFCKKLLTHSEQFELARVYNTLAKIKNSLRYRLKSLEDLFIDEETELKGKSIQNLTIKVSQFMNKIRELDIIGLNNRDLNLIANFLSSIDEEGNACISLLNLNAYFKKIELKYQFANLSDYKALVKELKKIISNKEEFARKWTGLCNRELIGFGEMRILLNYFNISDDVLDMILLKFVEQETSAVSFFHKITAFLEMNSFLEDSNNLKASNASSIAARLFQEPEAPKVQEPQEPEEEPKDCMDELVDLLEKYESKKTLQNAFNVCKKFDRDNTGRVNVADFVNILWYNLEFGKHPESESVLLNFQNEMIVNNNMKTLEYGELFDKLEGRRAARLTKANTEVNLYESKPDYQQEISLTKIIAEVANKIRHTNFNLDKALSFFDRDGIGLITADNFRKILRWTKADISDQEQLLLEDSLQIDSAINYKKFLDLLAINDKHINVQYDRDIWLAISKSFTLELFEKLNLNLEYLKYFYEIKKEANPLISAAVLEQMLHEFKDFNATEIETIVKYGVVGSINSLSQALIKLERSDLKWDFEYVHMPHFLTSVSDILHQKRDLPGKTETNRNFVVSSDEGEKSRLIGKVKLMLHERGVTMWECLLSSSSETLEGSSIAKYNFIRMLRMIDLDLTTKEKVQILKILDPEDTGKIDLKLLMTTFQYGQENSKKLGQDSDSLLLEKLIYGIYYGGMSLDTAFDLIDETKSGMVSQKEFIHGMSKLDLKITRFEMDFILKILKLDGQFSRISKNEFIRTLKKLMKKYNINPTRNFSFSLFAQIKTLIEKKHRNLRECFVEEDLHKSGFADLEMIRKAFYKFGMTNIKIHQIRTLVKLFRKDVNMGEDESEEIEEESESDKQNKTLDLSMEIQQATTKQPKKKTFDINDPNFRVSYDDFVRMIYDEVENNTNTNMQGTYQFLRKVYNLTRTVNEFTLFESFVYFDVNNQNRISLMQLKIGLQNMNIPFEQPELQGFWDILDKDKDNMVSFAAFFSAFLNAGCVDIIKFDEKITKLMKEFCSLASKKGNLEELFNRFDTNQNGSVKLDEFKLQCEKMCLEYKEEDLEEIFRVLCNPEELNPQLRKKKGINDSENGSRDENAGMQSYRAFNYKNLVAVFSFFRKKENTLKLLHKFDSAMKEKGLSYQKIFEDYLQQSGGDKKRQPSRTVATARSGGKKAPQQPKGINMTELKQMIKGLKMSLNGDEINLICDAFQLETISAKQMETIIQETVEHIEKEKNDKKILFQRISKEIEYAIQMKNSSIQKVFFEFDSRSDGRLKLDELNQMLTFLQVKATKTEVKALFEEIDFDKKGTITIKEFQSFLDQSFYINNKKEAVTDSGAGSNGAMEPIIKTLQDAAIRKQTSMERTIQSHNLDLNQIVSVKILEKVLLKMDCVLKRDEVKMIIEAASKDESCCWADVMDWGIKNNVDFRTKDKVFAQFPPAVQVILSKVLQIFKKMNLSIETAFKYFTREDRDVKSHRNEFLTLIQGLQVPTSEEELIGLYNFFDERNYGEITKNTFIEKCEIARDFYKWSDGLSDNNEKKGLTTLTLRQHVITILEKLYVSFLKNDYNKRQILAVFDKHGNGIISREDFIRICDNLGMPIPTDYRASLLVFLDPTESDFISLTTLINKMEESVPDNAKDNLKFSQAQGILREIVTKLQVHLKKFMAEYLDLEKKLQVQDILTRTKTGVAIYDFYRALSNYGIRLQESEKMVINAAFKNKKVPDYFDTEALYLALDKLSTESAQSAEVETENLEAWESGILRRVADRLRSMNLSLEKAFSSIHTNNLGFIKIVDFKQLLFSLDIKLSQKDVDLLIKRLSNTNNPNVISLEDFKQRFWACFFEGKSTLNPLNIDNRSRQIAGMLLHKIRYELKMPLSFAWDKLDRKQIGVAQLEDLRDFLLEIRMPITKEELGTLFSLIDQSRDSMIDQFEFVEFWNTSLAADFEPKKKKLKKFEADVLGQIAKKCNNSYIDLTGLFKAQVANSKNESLEERQMTGLLSNLGLNFNETTVREIMKLVNPNNPEKVSFNQLETALLRNGLKLKDKTNEVRIDFKDKVLMVFLNGLNVAANKLKVKVGMMIRDYDEDYDGLLSTHEFYNLIRSLETPFRMEEIQRLSHIFCSPSSPNKIEIDLITQAMATQEKVESQVLDNLCDADSFKAILEYFDPTLILFKRWGKLKQAKIRFEQYLELNKDGLRGLRLMAAQHKLKQLNDKLQLIHHNIKLLMHSLKNSSTQQIKDVALVKWVDPAHCSLTLNKKELQNIIAKQDGFVVQEYSTSQQFTLKYDSLVVLNRFVNMYRGTLLAEANAPIDIRVYSSETLKRISKDGKFFEDHLMYTIKLQCSLYNQYPDMFARVYGYYSRKVGVDPKDRDLYVFYEVLGSEWVSLRDFINSTGGFIRIPFLVTSNSIYHVVKHWFLKILAIADVCNQSGVCLYLLRPENIYVNHKTLEVKLLTLSGASRITHEGTLGFLSDLNLVLPSKNPDDPKLAYFKEEQYMADPFLAPEFFYAEISERTPYLDSWSLGCLLYLIIFGEDPISVWQNMVKEGGDSKNTKEPSEYYNYDIFPDRLINEILKYDYGIQVDKTDSLISRSIQMKSFEGVFREITKKYNPHAEMNHDLNNSYGIGSFLDIIQLLMTWKPHERPTARSLLYSKLFQSDKYQEMQMRQFSSLSFFYRSPSKCVRKDILIPLRALCAVAIEKPTKLIDSSAQIIGLIDRVVACLGSVESPHFQNLSDEFSKGKRIDDLTSSALLDSITLKIKQSENKRLKLPNYSLVKFVFENYVMDLLLFLVLRHHSAVNNALTLDEISAQSLEEQHYKPVKGYSSILKRMVFELNSYDSACAPFVSVVVDLLVKFTVGEEYCLASDIIDLLEKESTSDIKTNSVQEYTDLDATSPL